MIILLKVGLIKKMSLCWMSYSPVPYSNIKNKINVELDLSDYGTKSDLKNATGFNTSKFAKEADLASLKSDVDRLDIDELESTSIELSKLRNGVENEVVKKTLYEEQVKKVNAINIINIKVNIIDLLI